jgi:hypothetical protein
VEPALLLPVTDALPLNELHVHELGRSDGPTLMLLHGLSDSAMLAGRGGPLASRLPHRRPDARGHGESPRFDPATSGSNRLQGMVADVVALLDPLADQGGGIPILVGRSMGARCRRFRTGGPARPGPRWRAGGPAVVQRVATLQCGYGPADDSAVGPALP